MEVELSRRRLDVARAYRELGDPESGGVAIFVGRVRPDRSRNGTVVALWYEADERMAKPLLGTLVAEVRARHRARRVVLWHRLGELDVGEISVVVGVAAGHRADAFQGARFLIEAVKQRIPIWKTDRTHRRISRRGRRSVGAVRTTRRPRSSPRRG